MTYLHLYVTNVRCLINTLSATLARIPSNDLAEQYSGLEVVNLHDCMHAIMLSTKHNGSSYWYLPAHSHESREVLWREPFLVFQSPQSSFGPLGTRIYSWKLGTLAVEAAVILG